MGMSLRRAEARDVPALLTLPGAPSAEELHEQLFDAARGHGANTLVALEAGVPVGCVGWVEAPPWCFGAPVLARDEGVARRLVAHVVEQARASGASRVRIGVTPGEPGKRAALESAGFSPALDFIWYARALKSGEGRMAALPWRRVPWNELDIEQYVDARNDTFDGIPNAPPVSRDVMADELAQARIDRQATAAWSDEEGRYVAFVQVQRDTDQDGRHGIIDAIGVRAAVRGRGVARALLEDVMARVSGEVGELRALIASTNLPSIALHTSRGFREKSRRTIFEREVAPRSE